MTLPQQGQRIVWLVRLLATTGLAMGVIATGFLGWTLTRIRSERARALALEEPLKRAAESLRRSTADSEAEIQSLLDETVDWTNLLQSPATLAQLTRSCLDSSPDRAVVEPLTKLNALSAELLDLASRAMAWRTNYLPLLEDQRRQITISGLRDSVAQLRSSVEALEGRRRLAEAIKYRHWRETTEEASGSEARLLLLEQGRQRSHDTAEFKNQLAECARLVELLAGEEQFDNLSNLKDNQLKVILDRLTRSLSSFGVEADSSSPLSQKAVEGLKVALFGNRFTVDEAHQNIQPGAGGLFNLRREILRLRHDREKLKIEAAALFQRIQAANSSFALAAQVRTTELASHMERNLSAGWWQMLIFGGACSTLFIWLAWFIGRGVKAQVEALELARAEAEGARLTTQKLMLEQQVAAAELAMAHKDLQASEQRQKLIFDSISEGIHWIDRDGRIIFENPAAARLLGWEPSELLGRPAHATIHHSRADGSSFPVIECPVYEGLNTATTRHVDNEVFWRKDGSSFPVEYTSTPVRNGKGEIMGVVVVFSDIGERKRAELELERVHQELLDASRRAGMAEVATGVLHNVGNVLNSVNTSTTLLAENVSKSRVSKLIKIVELFREHESGVSAFLTEDPQGRKIPGYLVQLAELLSSEQAAILKELAALQKNVGHIKDIVSVQQSYAKVSGVCEVVNITDLVDDALGMNASSLIRHDVRLSREYEPALPTITVDKHKVLQILVNLIRNAKHACDATASNDKNLAVRVQRNNGCIRISVTDNGVGIPPENMTRIFNHGFTTKKDGHGFGLHSGALAARQMGGALLAQSDGPGTGATFMLDLPIKPTSAPAANQASAARPLADAEPSKTSAGSTIP